MLTGIRCPLVHLVALVQMLLAVLQVFQAPSFAFADYIRMNVEVSEEEQEGHHVEN